MFDTYDFGCYGIGIFDDFGKTCIFRAWGPNRTGGHGRIFLCPAMNTQMWEHPVTKDQLNTIQAWYRGSLEILDPISKQLACGDTGVGALCDIQEIVHRISSNVDFFNDMRFDFPESYE